MLSTPKGLLQSSFADGRRLQRNLFCLSIFALVMTLLLPLKVSQATSLQGGFCCPQLSANEGQFDAGGNPSPQFRAMSPSSHLQYLGYNYVGVAPETPQAIWVAKATAPWIHVYPAIGTTINGVGSGYCPFTLDPNSGSTRSATIIFSVSTPTGIVYEVPYKVGQLGSNNPCAYDTFDSSGIPVRYIKSGLAGTSGALKLVKLNGTGNCGDIKVTANRPWIKVTFKPATGEITYTVSPGNTDQTGAIIVAGRQIPVVMSYRY